MIGEGVRLDNISKLSFNTIVDRRHFHIYPCLIALLLGYGAYWLSDDSSYVLYALYFFNGWLWLTWLVQFQRRVIFDRWGYFVYAEVEHPRRYRLVMILQALLYTGFTAVMFFYIYSRL